MVGDSPWDCRAARRAKIKSIGVLSGRFSDRELLEAGASKVYESIVEMRRDLDGTPLG
jgi:phosphoglycolate phosphatase-like HAD superfamily hydrolase